MTVCTDVYIRPQTCDLIQIYPSQTHPTPPTGGTPYSSTVRKYTPRPVPILDDEDVATALLLLDLL